MRYYSTIVRNKSRLNFKKFEKLLKFIKSITPKNITDKIKVREGKEVELDLELSDFGFDKNGDIFIDYEIKGGKLFWRRDINLKYEYPDYILVSYGAIDTNEEDSGYKLYYSYELFSDNLDTDIKVNDRNHIYCEIKILKIVITVLTVEIKFEDE
jgi:hypothetical protein